jgi:non-ribosomal peptide synthetase component F
MTLIEDLPEDLCLRIHDCSKAHSLRPSVIFLAVFQLLLHRYTSYEDIIVGMAVNTRTTQKFAAEIGYFVNMVPIRTRCEDRLTFNGLLRRVQATMMDALDHSSYPFPLMLEKLKFKHTRRNPVFQVTYAYHDFVNEASFAPLWRQLALNIKNVKEIVQEGEHDLGLEIFEQEMSFTLHLKYNPEIYSENMAQRILRHYLAFLQEISKNLDRLLHEYSIVSEQERCQLLVDYNATQADYPKDKCLHQLFAEQVALQKDKTAVVYAKQLLTYEQLYERSQDLALYLQSIGVKPDSLVGLCAEKSVDMIVGLLGIEKRLPHRPSELSGGEQQRVALARALINKPAIVLADEPTGNLDSKNSEIVLDMLRHSNRELGQTVLMITHNPGAAEYADRIIHMRDGQIVPPENDPQWTGHEICK